MTDPAAPPPAPHAAGRSVTPGGVVIGAAALVANNYPIIIGLVVATGLFLWWRKGETT